jgi:hypothetical protein
VISAVFLQFLGLYFKFLLRKPKVELAFVFAVLLICVDHFMSSEI